MLRFPTSSPFGCRVVCHRPKDATSYRLIEAQSGNVFGGWYPGSPKNHPFLWAFSIINHPEMGVPPFMEKIIKKTYIQEQLT